MLLRLRPSAARSDVEAIQRLAAELGYETRFLDASRQVLAALPRSGTGAPADRSRFADVSSVLQVLDASDAPELGARASSPGPSRVRVGGARSGEAVFGGGAVSIVGGPCAVEDEERLVEVAKAVRRAGASLLRGGAFKPRTSPYSFQGLGHEGLERLRRVRAQLGLPVVTVVLDPREVERVADVANMFQIGSRSMTNFALLREVGRARKPVLLRRGYVVQHAHRIHS
jgi:3-deoxy-7-phosphoheptulonate synthase